MTQLSGGAGAMVAGFLSPTPFAGSALSILVGGGGLAYPTTAAKLGGTSIAHPGNFGCAGTGAGPSAVALAVEVAHAVRHMKLGRAKEYLENVLQHKEAIPFLRFKGARSRHAQAKNMRVPGSLCGWPTNAV